ncbi:transglycosylase SLT domain-containing protein [Frondihabitans sp. VKM Ac-2883]|uniref:aggregation-promoting factor C-terminal-like domain-containing protein n=1 Tax=Frondihabitans sp. VKM Ac-2883 TaxID=2783823 RepID=UPI001889F2C5|nr:transglycosylase SLT domain-containing protein [Frondihabitans sp. VKM Ac-2883]MBF4577815.1 transglycosylase SLT domain-containing protein [Frondihabitans sp. VKM Ac-2883]
MGRHSAVQASAVPSSERTSRHEHRAVVPRPRVSAPVRQIRPAEAAGASFAARPAGRRRTSRRVIVPLVGFAASFAFVSASLVNPLSGAVAATAAPISLAPAAPSAQVAAGQSYTVASGATVATSRDAYTVEYTAPVVKKAAPVVTTDTTTTDTATATDSSASATPAVTAAPAAAAATPGSAQAIGAELVAARGWGTDQYNCLVSLWNKESGWNVYAANPSGAYGIPQALPGSKMSSVGADWQTNPATQITWGLNYIQGRYGNPCGAWAHSVANNWY